MALRLPRGTHRDDTRFTKWASVRTRGRLRYILVTGVLGFALPVGVISELVDHWMGAPGPFWGRLGISLLLVPITGYFFGAVMWHFNERQYQRRSADRQH